MQARVCKKHNKMWKNYNKKTNANMIKNKKNGRKHKNMFFHRFFTKSNKKSASFRSSFKYKTNNIAENE